VLHNSPAPNGAPPGLKIPDSLLVRADRVIE
jgi:hypothetical protein